MHDPTIAHAHAADLQGKVALVTDMARPFGFAIAQRLAQAGATVHGVHADQRRCAEQLRHLCQWGPAFGHVVQLQDGLAAAQFAYQLNEEIPKLDFIVSNCRVAEAQAWAAAGAPAGSPTDAQGELALVHELLDALRQGASAQDPARVVLVGPFEAAAIRDAAARLQCEGVHLNALVVPDAVQDSTPGDPRMQALLSAVLAYCSANAAQRVGETVHLAA